MTLFTNKSTPISLFFSLLLACSCWAQPAPINRRAMAIAGLANATSIPNPTNISSRMYRWIVSQDAPSNVVLSNQLVDRIVGAHFWQMNLTKSPTNGPAGIRFWVNGQSLTNKPTGDNVGNISPNSPPDAIYCVFTPVTTAIEQQFLGDSHGQYGVGVNGNNLRYTGTISGGANTICPLTAGATNDVLIVFTATNTIWYTNGVVVKTNATSAVDVFPFGQIGVFNYNGSCFEVGIYTNVYFFASDATAIHKYATNKYGYTP